jgi:hypothetical protein
MSRAEILVTSQAEMEDMIACQAIENGAKQKKEKLSMYQMLFNVG